MKTILIAEGDENVARLFSSVFRQNGWEVSLPVDGNDAVDVLRGIDPFDVMLVSSRVRGADGFELIKLVRALDHRRRMPVIMVTGTGGIETEALAAGANEVLCKPIDMYKLVAAVDKYVAGIGLQAEKA